MGDLSLGAATVQSTILSCSYSVEEPHDHKLTLYELIKNQLIRPSPRQAILPHQRFHFHSSF